MWLWTIRCDKFSGKKIFLHILQKAPTFSDSEVTASSALNKAGLSIQPGVNAAVRLLGVLHAGLWFRAFIGQIKFSCSQYSCHPRPLPGCQLVFSRPLLTPLKKARNNVGLSAQRGGREIKMSRGAFKAASTRACFLPARVSSDGVMSQ